MNTPRRIGSNPSHITLRKRSHEASVKTGRLDVKCPHEKTLFVIAACSLLEFHGIVLPCLPYSVGGSCAVFKNLFPPSEMIGDFRCPWMRTSNIQSMT